MVRETDTPLEGKGSFSRRSGILLHPTSLPGPHGIGDLGQEAYRFADFLADTGQSLWQVLPLGPTGYGNSPYGGHSAFAGNPLLISLEVLAGEGLLDAADLQGAPTLPEKRVDYGRVKEIKMRMLRKSFDIFLERPPSGLRDEFEGFCEQNAYWLGAYALFMALEDAQGATWHHWEQGLKARQPGVLQDWEARLARQVEAYQYQQFLFSRQWGKLREYCHSLNIQIIGDMPIYVDLDSADVWWHPELFSLDENGQPTVVAGVPPDYFSETGQLWGNPLYRWEVMAQEGYAWWIARFQRSLALVDILRLDHFRGYESYWEVPSGEETAVGGRWVPGPGAALFQALGQALGDLPLIAEDLGHITPEVHALREQLGFPGMRVLQFGFGGDSSNPHLPHNYPRHCVVYTGTHDNDTALGWFTSPGDRTADAAHKEGAKRFALRYLGSAGDQVHWDLIRLALASVADLAIIPFQDVLGLGSEGRMNFPGKKKGNWEWRFTWAMVSDEMKARLRETAWTYGRHPLLSSPGSVKLP